MDAAAGGDVVTETLDFDGGRQVSVFLPDARPTAMIIAADGATVVGWGRLLGGAGMPPTAIVGVHALADEGRRLEEYSPVFDARLFAAHERFVIEDVTAWARARFSLELPAARTAAFGASAGGELALALGLAHPDVVGAVLCASPGAGFRPRDALPERLPRTYLVAGAREPFFRENAARWARALADAGGEVVFEERDGAHGSALWRDEFPRMVRWAFG